jgi:molybdate transport system ATP-binding protein
VLRHPLAVSLTRATANSGATAAPPTRNASRAATRGRALVELNQVTVRAGNKRLLEEVSWTIRPGERWLFIGHNGAGKTTLLSLLQGDHPQAHSVDFRLFGHRLGATHTLWQARRRIGWMSPELLLHHPPGWTVFDVVCGGFANALGLHHRPSAHQRRRVREWLKQLGLASRATDPLGALPVGEQRLALLARAVVKRPRLLLLDEPCQGLDATQRDRLLHAVDVLAHDPRLALVFVTHHPDERPRCITHRLALRAGRVVEAGPLRGRRS